MVSVLESDLHRFVTELLTTAGASERAAEVTAHVLIAADLGGVESHGIARLRRYAVGLRDGDINAQAEPAVVFSSGALNVVDADNGLGQPALAFATDAAVDAARLHGIAATAVTRSNHVGLTGWYAMRAAAHNMLCIVTTNAVPQVAPVGVADPIFGTDPLCYAIQAASGDGVCFDAATSVVSRGKIEQLGRLGEPMPLGWATGPDGQPTTDIPSTVDGLIHRRGYALNPLGGSTPEFGGHKGGGIALLMELLCGPIAGAQWSRNTYGSGGAGLGHFVICISLDSLPGDAARRSGVFLREVREAASTDRNRGIRLPGDRRKTFTEQRRAVGIPILDSVLRDLNDLATEFRVARLRVRPN